MFFSQSVNFVGEGENILPKNIKKSQKGENKNYKREKKIKQRGKIEIERVNILPKRVNFLDKKVNFFAKKVKSKPKCNYVNEVMFWNETNDAFVSE